MPRRLAVTLALAVVIPCACSAKAYAEPILVSIEAQGAMALTAPQSNLFGVGATGAVALQYPVTPMFLLGLRLRAGFLTNGDPPAERGIKDPGTGTFELAMLTLRWRPLATSADVRRATGLFVDVGGGGGATGQLARASFSAGLGYGFPIGSLALAPTVRYLQVLQPTTVLASDDARLLMVGLELTFGDARPIPPTSQQTLSAPRDRDRDHDGIEDANDKCPDVPEDLDGHEDADGCPEPDNDADGILDLKDKCPNDAEDFDEFEDVDGCPDPDNDYDGFVDGDDQCPNEAEVINGNKDYDGCPDEGLIVMENDRIVLEERVLFDFERARIRREVRPLLRAIIDLKQQHPEWVALRVEGHADARGDARFNQELSERRAQHVVDEMIRLGMPASQIHAVGFGSTRLRDKRDEDEAHQRNRRVEFVVEMRASGSPAEAAPAAPKPDGAGPIEREQDLPAESAAPGVAPKPAAAAASSLKPVGVVPAAPPPPPAATPSPVPARPRAAVGGGKRKPKAGESAPVPVSEEAPKP